MFFLWPWSLLAVAAVAAAAWWALRQPRQKLLRVGSLRLWQEAAQATSSSARRHRRRITAAWVLLLAGALAAAVALARPVHQSAQPARTLALEVYPSAELAGLPPGALAKAAAPLLNRLKPADRVRLLLPAQLANPSELSPRQALDRLGDLSPLPLPADQLVLAGPSGTAQVQHTYRFAPATLDEPAGPEVTNILLPALPGKLTIDAFAAQPAENSDQADVFLAVRNHTDSPADAAVDFYTPAGKSPAATRTLPVPSRGRATLSLRLPQDDYLCAALVGQDGPGARACLSRQRNISAKLAMVGRDDPLVRRFIQINPALRLVEDAALADAVIAIAALPPGDKPALVIDPPQPPPGYRPGEKLTNLPLRQADLQADSPLLRYVDFAAVAVRQSQGWREGDLSSGQKIVSYQGQVLVLAQDAPRRLFVAFDFDPENTNFGLTDSFVAFLANATGWLLPQARRQVSYSALRPDQAQFGQAPSDWQELLFAQGHSAAEAAGEAPAASEISRSGMPERHSDAASPLPWPGVYRDRSGALQAVSLTGLRSANPPRDPAELAANAPLPAPQQIGARQELWPAFLIAAALLWLAGWTVRLR